MAMHQRTKRMIKLVAILVICLIVSAMAFVSYFMHAVYEVEEPINMAEVPFAVVHSLEQRYPGARHVVWEFEDDQYEAEFSWQDWTEMEAAFGLHGAWISTDFVITLADLPEKARSYVAAQEGYEVLEVERIERSGGPDLYEVELGSKLMKWECEFDAVGNLLTREREGPVLEQAPIQD